MAKHIPLTQGQTAIVCDCHYHLVKDYKWFAKWDITSRAYYAFTAHTSIRMHSLINNTPDGYVTDHINHNTLDNRCINLRTATISQNHYNRRLQRNNTSGFKGVSKNSPSKTWRAYIRINGKKQHLGCFVNREDAARAYDEAALKYYGEFAYTNSQQ